MVRNAVNKVKHAVSRGYNAVKNKVKQVYSKAVNTARRAAEALAAKKRAAEEAARREKERAVQWIKTKRQEVVNSVKKINVSEAASGLMNMVSAGGAVLVGAAVLMTPGVGLVAGAVALGSVVCGTGMFVTGAGETVHGLTGVDPVRNLAKSLGMSDKGYDTMKDAFFWGSAAGSIFCGNALMMATSAGNKIASAEREQQVVTRNNTGEAERRSADLYVAPNGTVVSSIDESVSVRPSWKGGACFVAGTLIVTELGDKPIEEIKIGDKVYSENVETREKGYKEVRNIFVKEVSVLVHLIVNGSKIDTTLNHPFWVVGEGWIEAGYLKAGDKVKLKTGEIGYVESIQVEKLDKPVKVYNFEVADWHTYFVSDIGVLVHNTCMMENEGVRQADNIPGRGYHKEVYANKPVKVTEAVDKWDEFLGPGEYTDIHPRTGLKDPDRIFSADGKRSIRFGSHEMNSKPSKFHYHEEIWTYDPINNVMNVDNTVVRVPYKN